MTYEHSYVLNLQCSQAKVVRITPSQFGAGEVNNHSKDLIISCV